MTTSAASSLRNKVLFLILAFVLVGCIQPDAPYPGGSPADTRTPIFPPTSANGGQGGIPTAVIFPTMASGTEIAPPTNVTLPTFQPSPFTPLATQPSIPPTVFIPTSAATPEPALFIWGFFPVGPEQVAVMFYQGANATRCVRYIYRNKVIERCPQTGQTLVTVTGVEEAANKQQYTIVAGRTFSDTIRTVTIEFVDGTSQPLSTNAGGYVAVIPGVKQPIRAVPIDQSGNTVGGVVPIR